MEITDNDIAPEIIALLDFNMIFGRRGNSEFLIAALRPLPLEATLRFVTALAAYVNHNSKHDVKLQVAIARDFGAGVQLERDLLISLLEKNEGIWLHEEQLAVMPAWVIMYCKGRSWPKDGNRCIFRALLLLNDLRNLETTRDIEGADKFLASELRSIATDGESGYFTLLRYGKFISWVRSDVGRAFVDDWVDIDKDFEAAKDIGIDDFRAAIILLQGHYWGPATPEEFRNYDAAPDMDQILANIKHREAVDKVVKLLSTTLPEAQEHFAKAPPGVAMLDMLLFANRPLLQVQPNRYALPVNRYLVNAAVTGLFYQLSDLYSKAGTEQFDRFRRLFGHFLEDHVRQALRNATVRVADAFDGDRPYMSRNGEARMSDAYAVFGDSLVIVEITASRFNVRRTLVEERQDALDSDMYNMVIRKFEQLRDRHKDWLSGRFEINGVDRSKIKKIYAVVVTAQAVPRMIAFDARLKAAIGPITTDFTGYEILETEEIELLERQFPGGDLHLAGMLSRKLRNRMATFRSLTNYLYFFEKHTLLVRKSENVLDEEFFAGPLRLAQSWFKGS